MASAISARSLARASAYSCRSASRAAASAALSSARCAKRRCSWSTRRSATSSSTLASALVDRVRVESGMLTMSTSRWVVVVTEVAGVWGGAVARVVDTGVWRWRRVVGSTWTEAGADAKGGWGARGVVGSSRPWWGVGSGKLRGVLRRRGRLRGVWLGGFAAVSRPDLVVTICGDVGVAG